MPAGLPIVAALIGRHYAKFARRKCFGLVPLTPPKVGEAVQPHQERPTSRGSFGPVQLDAVHQTAA